jgi:hypothetical protein
MARFPANIFFLLVLLTAALWAQQPSSSPRPPAHTKPFIPQSGAISNGVYHNPSFDFSYKLPYGWVDRTREMQDDSPNASNTAKSLLLLAVFERPPEASGDTVNSAVVIAAEPLSNYSGMKTAVDYFGPLTELAIAKGFQVVEEPHAFSLGSAQLVRGDFSKSRGPLTMHQTSLVILEKGYELSFTFIGGSEDEISELIEKVSFGSRKTTSLISPRKLTAVAESKDLYSNLRLGIASASSPAEGRSQMPNQVLATVGNPSTP